MVFLPRETATLIVPVRFLPVVLGDTMKVAVPGPEPEPPIMVIQDAAAPFGLAVQVHAPAVAVTVTLCCPPGAATVSFAGETAVTLQSAPAWVTEKTEPPMVTEALLGVAMVFAVTEIFTFPLLLA